MPENTWICTFPRYTSVTDTAISISMKRIATKSTINVMTAWRNQNWSGKVYFLWSSVCLGNVVKSRNQFYRWVPLITPITIDGKNKCMTKFWLSKLSFSTSERGVVYPVHCNENLKHFKRESYWFWFSSQNYVGEMGTFRGNFVIWC